MGAVEGGKPWSCRTRETGAHRGMNKENVSPNPLSWKLGEAEFPEFLQPAGLEA